MPAQERLEQIKSHLSTSNNIMSDQVFFPSSTVPLAPPDAIFALTAAYKADTSPTKINLGVGAYRDASGKPWVLPSIKKASAILAADETIDHEYLPIAGLSSFVTAAQGIVFGKGSKAVEEGRVISVQTLSGTGANHLGVLFLSKFYDFGKGDRNVYISDPTWANHNAIISNVGLKPVSYPYYDPLTIGLNFTGYINALNSFPEGSVILVHGCAHNPTGVDPTDEEWEALAQVFLKKGHFAFIDNAYQGFATGDLEADGKSIKLFVEKKIPLLVCQSFAKNAGLYNERVGAIHFVSSSKEEAERVKSQLLILQRSEISNPPAYGANLVSMLLTQPELFADWQADIKTMSSRIIEMRQVLFDLLDKKYKTPAPAGRKDWGHVKSQIGMFSFTGLTPQQTKTLVEKYSIYLTGNGRISMAGLNHGNVEFFAKSVDEVVRATTAT